MMQDRKKADTSIRNEAKGLTRRQFTCGAVSALAAASMPWVITSSKADKPLTFASFGGYYNDFLKKHFIDSFVRSTGIDVRMASNTSLASLKGQIVSNAVQWDIAELTGSEYELAMQQGIPLEPLNLDIVRTNKLPEYAVGYYGVKYAYFLEVMTWDKRAISDPPSTWSEFFDPEKYKGRRALYTTFSDSMLLEFALIADGVPLDRLYPLDVDRALGVLERLSPEQILWYETNTQGIEVLINREVELGMPFTGRVLIANRGGASLGYTPNQGGATGDYLVVPKGSRNVEKAMRLIDHICNDNAGAKGFMEETLFGLANIEAIQTLEKSVAEQIPTSPSIQDTIFHKNDKWWSENLNRVTQQFRAWQWR